MMVSLKGVTTQILMIFFQALNAKTPRTRDEIYHSSEWVKLMDPFLKSSPGPTPNTVIHNILLPEGNPGAFNVEGGSFDYLERCLKEAISAGTYGFLASKHVLEAESVLKKAAEEK